jgi:hypothetical protein
MPLYTKSGEKQSAVMVPTGSGILDVVNDFTWTLSNNKAEVPVAYVTEYQINSGQLLAGLYYYGKQISDTARGLEFGSQLERGGPATPDPYQFMYFATPTGFNYAFPWLGSEKFARSNEFSLDAGSTGLKEIGNAALAFPNTPGEKKGLASGVRYLAELASGISAGGSLIGNIASKAIVGNIGLNSSKSWTGTGGQNYTINFDLINTFNNTNEIRKNRELAYLLTYQNSPFRRNFAVIDPVCIYQLSIPDVVHFPACYVSSLNISNIGNTRSLNLDGEVRTIPEGYSFSIEFSSLIEESRNIFYGVESSSSRVQAISDQHAWDSLVAKGGDLANLAKDKMSGLFGSENQ